ncbi:hypothetical protein CYMTET_54083 [Cymbomonas tetramitiformis]|uniref:Uncharacterized protein n=1 Tax=Cymbomonas tetramitiformis TaxID=36881 RepID=A0AAE0BGV4_9CHLO|nr:hypothetical protein CYMTET_54083 [Cymbomonas tetramitiformis]
MQLRRSYYDKSNIPKRHQQMQLSLNFLSQGVDIILSNFLASLDTTFVHPVHPGHAPALLNLDYRLATEPCDEVCNNMPAQILHRVAKGCTRHCITELFTTTGQHMRTTNSCCCTSGLWWPPCPRRSTMEPLEVARAIYITEPVDPAQFLAGLSPHGQGS